MLTAEDCSEVSTFAPETFAEAKEAFKPLRRSRMRRQSDFLSGNGKSPLSPIKASKTASGLKRRPSSAIPYATNSLGARKKKGKRAKKLTDGQLKKRVWKEFSIFIRTMGAGPEGLQQCFTCSHIAHWKTLEAGHLVPGRTNAVLFNELAVKPQCRRCNGHFRGNTIVYYPKLVGLIGQEAVDQIVAQRDVTHKWQPGELLGLLEHYRSLNKANPLLKEQK